MFLIPESQKCLPRLTEGVDGDTQVWYSSRFGCVPRTNLNFLRSHALTVFFSQGLLFLFLPKCIYCLVLFSVLRIHANAQLK